jgi:hypothetical protein
MPLMTLFDAVPCPIAPFEIRAPKRSGGYQGQVWIDSGFWTCGIHPTRPEARRAGQRFAATNPVEPAPRTPRAELPPNWQWKRRRYDEDAPRWVRRVKGGAYQSRYHLEMVGGSLNLGLFTLAEHPAEPGRPDGEMAAWAARAAKSFRRLWSGDRSVQEAVENLQMKRPLPADAPKDWKLRTPWVPPGVEVPEKWKNLTLPTEYGETEFADERRATAKDAAEPAGLHRARPPDVRTARAVGRK